MVKYSFIIPVYGNIANNNFRECITSLLRQTFKDFEIIICGNKVIDNNFEYFDDIKVSNVVIDTNRIGKLINEGYKISVGEFIHIWAPDLVIYPDYVENLNNYISKYGDNNLFAGHLIDTRALQSKNTIISNDIYFVSFEYPEGFYCIHKRYFEPFREEFEGFATHWCQEHCYRLWKKIKFIRMLGMYVVHIPHPMRISYEQSIIDSQKSSQLFEVIKNES